jgi:predicted nucleic acid-binding Zn ribbon protein
VAEQTGQDAAGQDAAGQARRDPVRLAREALAAVRADAQARGLRPARAARPETGPQGPPDASLDASQNARHDSRPDASHDSRPDASPGRDLARPPRPAPSVRASRRVRRDDPQTLGSAIEGLLDAEGWNAAAATGSVFGRWAQIVGADLAGHTQPESLRDGELTVVADSTAWATQLRLLSAQLVHRLNAELGTGTIQRVRVRGPVTATRMPGEWRVRGSRGPRDTYG